MIHGLKQAYKVQRCQGESGQRWYEAIKMKWRDSRDNEKMVPHELFEELA